MGIIFECFRSVCGYIVEFIVVFICCFFFVSLSNLFFEMKNRSRVMLLE